jgi:hypothetical protein
VMANPCVLAYVAGRNPLSRAHQQDISIVQERIAFDLRGKPAKHPADAGQLVGSVRINYELDNRGPASEVMIGFPIGRYADPFYPARDIIQGFRVKGHGAGPLLPEGSSQLLTLDRAGIKSCERQNGAGTTQERTSAGAGYAWYLWRQTFEPGINRLEIRYDLLLLSDVGADGEVQIDYVLSTTAGWGDGKIGKLEVDFRTQGLAGAWQVVAGLPEGTALAPGRHLRWSTSNFAPKEDLRFRHIK